MRRGDLGRNDPCICGSDRKYKKCCYPRTLPDFRKPNAGIATPFEETEALYRALSRLEAIPPHNGDMTIDKVDVGRTRLTCAPLLPYSNGDAVAGTLAPPTPAQIEASRDRHRSPLLWQCVADHQAGRRHPLALLGTDPSVYAPRPFS